MVWNVEPPELDRGGNRKRECNQGGGRCLPRGQGVQSGFW